MPTPIKIDYHTRLAFYLFAYDFITKYPPKYSIGFCYCMQKYFGKNYKQKLIISDLADLYKNKPHSSKIRNGFWFNQYDKKPRLALLEKVIPGAIDNAYYQFLKE